MVKAIKNFFKSEKFWNAMRWVDDHTFKITILTALCSIITFFLMTWLFK